MTQPLHFVLAVAIATLLSFVYSSPTCNVSAGEIEHESTGYCYKFIDQNVNFFRARELCVSWRPPFSRMASAHNDDDMDALGNVMVGSNAWVGLLKKNATERDSMKTKPFWTDGSKFDYGEDLLDWNDAHACSRFRGNEFLDRDCMVEYNAICRFKIPVNDTYTCGGMDSQSDLVCSGNGLCIDQDLCLCDPGYNGSICENSHTCYEIDASSEEVCSGGGICYDTDFCYCNKGFFGELCSECYTCNDICWNDENVCNGNGDCVCETYPCDDNDQFSCDCHDGYSGEFCDMYYCREIAWNAPNNQSCGVNGDCLAPETCVCRGIYVGSDACEEQLPNKVISDYDTDSYIYFEYYVPVNAIDQNMTNCSFRFPYQRFLPEGSTCMWVLGENETNSIGIKIEFSSIIQVPDELVLQLVISNETVRLSFFEYKDDEDDSNDKIDNDDSDDSSNLENNLIILFTSLWISFLAFDILCVFLISLLCILLCVYYSKLKKTKKEEKDLGNNEFELDVLDFAEVSSQSKNNPVIKQIEQNEVKKVKELNSSEFMGKWKKKNCQVRFFPLLQLDRLYSLETGLKKFNECNSQYLLSYYGFVKPPKAALVYECSNYLKNHIKLNKPNMKEKAQILLEICYGLQDMYEAGISHGDLSIENIYYKTKVHLGYGMGRHIVTGIENKFFIAPEILEIRLEEKLEFRSQKREDHRERIKRLKEGKKGLEPLKDENSEKKEKKIDKVKCDIFSLAFVFYQVLSENFDIYSQDEVMGIAKKMSNGSFRPKMKRQTKYFRIEKSIIPSWSQPLINKMWDVDPEKRPSLKEIISTVIKQV